MAAYLSGAETVRLDSEEDIARSDRTVIRQFLRSTRGFEFGDESKNSLTLICLLSSGELPISSSLNQMYLQLSSLVRDIQSVLLGGQLELIEDHDEREREVDALLHLIDRQVGAMLDSHDVAESLGLDRRQAVEHSNLARTLERMMDHADQMAALVLAAESRPEMSIEEAPLSLLPDWLNVMKTLMIQLRVRDPVEIEAARNILKQAQVSLAAHEEELWTEQRKRASLLFDSRCSESIRRLCAYARDFGEVLLNILVYDGSMSESD
jgi:phosphate uptake regulator